MSRENISRWLDSELEPELAHLLESSAADEPSAERLRDFEARMALTLAAGAAGVVATSTTAVSQAKLGAGLTKLGMVWAKVTLAAKVSVAVGAVAVLGSAPMLIKRAEAPARERAPQVAAKAKAARIAKTTHSDSALPLPVAQMAVEDERGSVPEVMAPPLPSLAPQDSKQLSRIKPKARKQMSAPVPPVPAVIDQATPAASTPQLEREVALLKRMREALSTNPCEVATLATQHRASFASPLLAPERDHIEKLAREHAVSATCPPKTK